MARQGADVVGIGMVSSVGLTAVTTAASVRAGTCRFRDTGMLDRRFEPMALGLVPDDDLPPLNGALRDGVYMGMRPARMVRLAGRALDDCLEGAPRAGEIPLFLGVPDSHPGYPAPVDQRFLDHLATQAKAPFDIHRSRLFPNGRAAFFVALCAALRQLRAGEAERVMVGGVDSYWDSLLLGALDYEDRILGAPARDGFIPGEGAAVLLLAKAGSVRRGEPAPVARIDEAAVGSEPGHRYSREVYVGDGLDSAFRQLFDAWDKGPPIETVYAGLNGESFNTKEWGVSYVRHRERFAEDFAVEHPVDCFGDPGAALGAMMTALGAIGMQRGYRRSPCLVWCSSDMAERGAAVVSDGG